MPPKIMAVYNQKGGVGKTMITWALASILKAEGYNVLCVDMDSQCNLTVSVGAIDADESILEALLKQNLKSNIYNVKAWGDIVPGDPNMDGLTLKARKTKQDYLLQELLRQATEYNIVLIDCPPGLGLSNINALTAADYLLTPASLDVYAIQGINTIIDVVKTIKAKNNPSLEWLGVCITDYKPRLTLTQHLEGEINKLLSVHNIPLLQTKIRYTVKVKEAVLQLEPIPKDCTSYADYTNLAKEIVQNGKF